MMIPRLVEGKLRRDLNTETDSLPSSRNTRYSKCFSKLGPLEQVHWHPLQTNPRETLISASSIYTNELKLWLS